MEFIEFKCEYEELDVGFEKRLYYRCRKPKIDASGHFRGWSKWGKWTLVY